MSSKPEYCPSGTTQKEIEKIPLFEPTQVYGQWYYRSRHSLWVLRTVDDPRYDNTKKPCWAYWGDYQETIKPINCGHCPHAPNTSTSTKPNTIRACKFHEGGPNNLTGEPRLIPDYPNTPKWCPLNKSEDK